MARLKGIWCFYFLSPPPFLLFGLGGLFVIWVREGHVGLGSEGVDENGKR